MSLSRLAQARPAVRQAMKGRMMISGPSGAGKTRSGLIIATELAEGAPVLMIDTEKESGLTYADDFEFVHLPWHPPFDVVELVQVLGEAGPEYGVIFLDSASHFWRKEGGILDVAGGKFTGWKEARPLQESLVEAILTSPAHVILGVRSKVEHTQQKDEKTGKQEVKKLGMAAQQDDDLEFEMNVAVEMSMDHTATISKSRTTVLPVGRGYGPSRTADMARLYAEWLKSGEPSAAKSDVVSLVERMNALSATQRKACKDEFFNRHGKPEQLRASQVDEARALVASYEQDAWHAEVSCPSASDPFPAAAGREPCLAGRVQPDIASQVDQDVSGRADRRREPQPDKKAIKTALLDGEALPGAHLVEHPRTVTITTEATE